jgi:hypothetical protein
MPITALPLITGIQAELANRADRSPKIAPGEFLRLALDIQALSERGLTPVINVDPFTGGTVLSTSDQSGLLFDLLGTRFATAALAGTPADSASLLRAREEFIQSRREGTPPVDPQPTVRDQVVAALSTSTAKLVAPGIVAKKTSSLAASRRLGGPCAGANTGFSRLNCARGGFS